LQHLALAIEHRGLDATGVCLVGTRDNTPRVTKMPQPASEFFRHRKGIGAKAHTALVHTRFGTQGKETNPLNNHPVESGRIIGIHNGMIDNDYDLFRTNGWPRHGEVDSEAIFAAIDHLGITLGLEAVEGSMAVAFIDRTDPHVLYLARGDSSPLYYGEYHQGVFFGSTKAAITQFGAPQQLVEMAEGDLVKIRAGRIEGAERFIPQRSTWMMRPYPGMRFTAPTTGLFPADHDEFLIGDRVRMIGSSMHGTVIESYDDYYEVRWDNSEVAGKSLIASRELASR